MRNNPSGDLTPGQSFRKVICGRILMTFCGLLCIAGITFGYDNRVINYLLAWPFVFDICAKQLPSRSLEEKVKLWPMSVSAISLNSAQCCFGKNSGQRGLFKSEKLLAALCRFLGNTLLGTLGTEIAGLRGIFQPAVAFLQFSAKELTQRMGHHTT
jgi:hypothetical protein